jgi:hypothetical protein
VHFRGRQDALRAIREVVDQTAMPSLPSFQRNVEAQSPIEVHRWLAVSLAGADDDFRDKNLCRYR